MATVDTETPALAAAGLSFLSLPPEVRNMIYRLLLVADKPLGCVKTEKEGFDKHGIVWASPGDYHIQPAILRVCWQVYREAISILNCENTFSIYIGGMASIGYYDESTMSSFRHSDTTDELSSFWDSSMDKFQRLEIFIEGGLSSAIKSSVGELCRELCHGCLSKSHALQHLVIYAHGFPVDENYKVLGPFGVLRNLHSVDIYGASPQYAQRLKRLMLGKTPPEDLDGMYHMLRKYVLDLNGDLSDLEKAWNAMRDWDVQSFKEIRSKILSDGQDRIDNASRHLFDFDLKDKEDHHTANVIVEDATAMPKDRQGPQAEQMPRED